MLYRIPRCLSNEEKKIIQERTCDICRGKMTIYGLINGLITRFIPNDASVALSLYSESLGGQEPIKFGLYSFDSLLKTLTLDHLQDKEAGIKDRLLYSMTSKSKVGKLDLGLNQQEVIDACCYDCLRKK